MELNKMNLYDLPDNSYKAENMINKDDTYTNKRVVNLVAEDKDYPDEIKDKYLKRFMIKKNEELRSTDQKSDVQILEDAHTVLLRRTGRRDESVDTYTDFLKYKEVRQMIQDLALPIIQKLPIVKKQADETSRSLSDLKATVKQYQSRFDQIEYRLKGMTQLNQELGEHSIQINAVKSQNDKRNQDVSGRIGDLSEKHLKIDEAFKALMDRQKHQDFRLEECYMKLDADQERIQNQFDKWYSDLATQVKKVQGAIRVQNVDISHIQVDIDKIKGKIDVTVQEAVRDIHKKYSADEEKFNKILKRLATNDKKMEQMQRMCNNVGEIQKKIVLQDQIVRFTTHSLPILTHMQICEALEKVVGPDYREQYDKFEKAKNLELQSFNLDPRNFSCVKPLSSRIQRFFKYSLEKGKGILPFQFNRDFHGAMTEEEVSHMGSQYDKYLLNRQETLMINKAYFAEALLQCQYDRRRQSEIVLKHKIQHLTDQQLLQLRDQIAVHKIKNCAQFNSIVKEDMDPFSDVQIDYVKRIIMQECGDIISQKLEEIEIQPGGPMSRKTVPMGYVKPLSEYTNEEKAPPQTTFFVLRKEQKRLYQRQERRNQKIFGLLYQDIKKFKDSQNSNFAKTTKMIMELNKDGDLIKKVVEDLNTSQTQYNTVLEERFQRDEEKIQDNYDKVADMNNRFLMKLDKVQQNLDKTNQFTFDLEENISKIKSQQNQDDQLMTQLKEKYFEMQTQLKDLDSKLLEKVKLIEEKMATFNTSLNSKQGSSKTSPQNSQQALKTKMSISTGNKSGEGQHQNDEPISEEASSISDSNIATVESPSDIDEDKPVKRGSTMIVPRKKIQPGQTEQEKKKIEEQKKVENDQSKIFHEKEKRLKQQKYEQKRREEQLFKQRQKQRIEREERERKKQEELELEKERMRIAKEKQIKIDEQLQIQQQMKLKALSKFQGVSKSVKMGASFLNKLGEQKAESEMAVAKINQKLEAITPAVSKPKAQGGSKQASRVPSKKILEVKKAQEDDRELSNPSPLQNQILKKTIFDEQKVNKTEQQKVKIIVQNTEIDDDVESESEDEDFPNPFQEMMQKGKGISETEIHNMIGPKFDQLCSQIVELETSLKKLIKTTKGELKTKIDDIQTPINFIVEDIRNKQAEMLGDVKKMKTDNEKFVTVVKIDMQNVQNQLESEKKDIVTNRKQLREEVNGKLQGFIDNDIRNKYEFERLNSYIEAMTQQMHRIIQDNLLMQLLQEQEILDRKQISLFGMKTNQQIVGKNQYAMNNNLSPGRGSNIQSSTLSAESTNRGGEIWDSKLRKKEYTILRSPQYNHNTSINASIMSSTMSKNHPFVDPNQQLPAIDPIKQKPFIERYYEQNTYNTIQMDRKCASCITGTAPHVLSLLKMACLNYVNSPVSYGNKNTNDQLQLSFPQVLQLKEILLQKIQNQQTLMDQMLIKNKSNFGTLYQEMTAKSKDNTFESSRTHIYMQENGNNSDKNTERMEAKDIIHLAQKFYTHRQNDSIGMPSTSPVSNHPFDNIENSTDSIDDQFELNRDIRIFEKAVDTHKVRTKIEINKADKFDKTNKYDIEVLHQLMRLQTKDKHKSNFDDMLQKLSCLTENSVLERFNKSNNIKQKSLKLAQPEKGALLPTRHSVNLVKHSVKIKDDVENQNQKYAQKIKNFSTSMSFQRGALTANLKKKAVFSNDPRASSELASSKNQLFPLQLPQRLAEQDIQFNPEREKQTPKIPHAFKIAGLENILAQRVMSPQAQPKSALDHRFNSAKKNN